MQSRRRGVQGAHAGDGIGFGGALVAAIALDARKAQGEAGGIVRTGLHVVERNKSRLRRHLNARAFADDGEIRVRVAR